MTISIYKQFIKEVYIKHTYIHLLCVSLNKNLQSCLSVSGMCEKYIQPTIHQVGINGMCSVYFSYFCRFVSRTYTTSTCMHLFFCIENSDNCAFQILNRDFLSVSHRHYQLGAKVNGSNSIIYLADAECLERK